MPALNKKSVVTWKDVLLTFNWVVRKWWTGLKEFLNSATGDVFEVADANFVDGVLAYLPRDWVVEGSIPDLSWLLSNFTELSNHYLAQ